MRNALAAILLASVSAIPAWGQQHSTLNRMINRPAHKKGPAAVKAPTPGKAGAAGKAPASVGGASTRPAK